MPVLRKNAALYKDISENRFLAMSLNIIKKILPCILLGFAVSAAHASCTTDCLFRIPETGLKASVTQPSSGTDPYYSSVASLLPLDTASGSPVVADAKGGSWSTSNLSLSGAQSEVGTGSLAFTSTTSWATGPVINLTGDFTIELWVYPTNISATSQLIAQWSQQTVSGGGWGVTLANGAVAFGFDAYSNSADIMVGGAVKGNTWSHIAVTRKDSTFREFVNGSLVATATFSTPGVSISVPVTIGNYIGFNGSLPASGVSTYQGYMQQVRITNGVARYTSAFTPSTSPDPTQ